MTHTAATARPARRPVRPSTGWTDPREAEFDAPAAVEPGAWFKALVREGVAAVPGLSSIPASRHVAVRKVEGAWEVSTGAETTRLATADAAALLSSWKGHYVPASNDFVEVTYRKPNGTLCVFRVWIDVIYRESGTVGHEAWLFRGDVLGGRVKGCCDPLRVYKPGAEPLPSGVFAVKYLGPVDDAVLALYDEQGC